MLRIKRAHIFEIIIIALISFGFFKPDDVSENITLKTNNHVISSIAIAIEKLDSMETSLRTDPKRSLEFYEAARSHFKKVSFYTEYFFPFHSRYFINGPLVNKAEFEYGYKTFSPHGFQVIESILIDKDTSYDPVYEISLLKQSLLYVKKNSEQKTVSSARLIDMIRFELIRITSLYLNGYDSPAAQANVTETAFILQGMDECLQLNFKQEQTVQCRKIIGAASAWLQKNADYNELDRMHFFMKYIKPLYEELHSLYDLGSLDEKLHFAVNIRNKEFYSQQWLNKDYFSVVLKDSALHQKQAELGKLLFFDPLLSGNNQRACASCHKTSHAFGGNTTFDPDFNPHSTIKRNTPSLLNAFLQKSFFYDGRSLQLEEQANAVLENPHEMFSDPAGMVSKLKKSPGYTKIFGAAFAGSEDTAITYYAILKSLSEFERTLVSLNSRFDKYLQGDQKQMNHEEIKGFNIFSGKALCGSCHFFPLFNGLVPPFYSDNEFEVIGVPASKKSKTLDTDSGRYHVSKNPIHLHAFKTTGIRNIEQTAPYMHNGAFSTLDEVLDFYNKGGGKGLGIDIENQTLPFDSLQLSAREISYLKKFLLTLTDKTVTIKPPVSLPKVNISGLEHRKIGGNY